MSRAEMNDPHVEKLFYKATPSEDTDYEKAPPISGETDDFKWHLTKDRLKVDMKAHCATEGEARDIVDEYLKGWEIAIGLHHGPDYLKFTFMKAEIVDRNPNTEKGVINMRTSIHATSTTLDAVLHNSQNKFLPPIQKFKVSPEVEMMYSRYSTYRKGKESLLSMAYWCFTVTRSFFGDRHTASKKLQISDNVLSKLSFLSSNRGDPIEARKKEGQAGLIPLTDLERRWIVAVVKRLILRFGEYAFAPNAKLPTITMADFRSIQ